MRHPVALTALLLWALLLSCCAVFAEAPFVEASSAEKEDVVLFSQDDVTVTVPAKYAAQIKVDSLYGDDFCANVVNLYYAPDYAVSGTENLASECNGWFFSVQTWPLPGAQSGVREGRTLRATDETTAYLELSPAADTGFYADHPAHADIHEGMLAALTVDYGNLIPYEEGKKLTEPTYLPQSLLDELKNRILTGADTYDDFAPLRVDKDLTEEEAWLTFDPTALWTEGVYDGAGAQIGWAEGEPADREIELSVYTRYKNTLFPLPAY